MILGPLDQPWTLQAAGLNKSCDRAFVVTKESRPKAPVSQDSICYKLGFPYIRFLRHPARQTAPCFLRADAQWNSDSSQMDLLKITTHVISLMTIPRLLMVTGEQDFLSLT